LIRLHAANEDWLRAAFAPPRPPLDLARTIMDQLDLRFHARRFPVAPERLNVAASPAGITRVFLKRGGDQTPAVRAAGHIGKILEQAREELREYLAGERTFFTVPVDLSQVPPFERSALEMAAQIPYGEVRSYKWIAERLGKPEAARAVGNAMASNPVPIIVPCHRVVRTDGSLGGYSFGLVRKESLLELERRRAAYVGCATTKIVCRRGCQAERRVREGNRVSFVSFEDARASGYTPCSICQAA